jgi:predicted double-glycine peptidase
MRGNRIRPALGLALTLLIAGCGGTPEAAFTSSFAAPDRGALGIGSAETGGASLNLRVSSIRARRFATTIRQQYDFSCGSAAVATLLTFHYDRPTDEATVFRAMLEAGDEERIRSLGFSLLDMQRYLATRGLNANGYRLSLDRLAEARVPAIALIDNNGYRHFVVVRGVSADRVLLADPNLGTRTITRSRFEASWNGVLFVILDAPEQGQAGFGRPDDWDVRPRAPNDLVRDAMERQLDATGMPAPLLINAGVPPVRFLGF